MSLPELHAVVKVPWFEDRPPWPWPIADAAPFSFVRLSPDMSDTEVGTVMARLVDTNLEECEFSTATLLAAEIAQEGLFLPGGIQAVLSGREINPGCCSGVDDWRGWLSFLEDGTSPWMGHDPWPELKWAGDNARLRANRDDAKTFTIDIPRTRYIAELGRVESDLRGFLIRVGAWADMMGWQDAPLLCQLLDRCLSITDPGITDPAVSDPGITE